MALGDILESLEAVQKIPASGLAQCPQCLHFRTDVKYWCDGDEQYECSDCSDGVEEQELKDCCSCCDASRELSLCVPCKEYHCSDCIESHQFCEDCAGTRYTNGYCENCEQKLCTYCASLHNHECACGEYHHCQ